MMDGGAESYKRYLEGDDEGFVEIVKEYKDGLILYLAGYSGSVLTAEELAEDTFVKLGMKRPRFLGRSSFKTWLYTIGRNTALDYLRKRAKLDAVPLDEIAELEAETTIEREYLESERRIAVFEAMNELKPEYRQVLWLIYFEGFRYKEAAAIMKKSVHAAEMLASRARAELKTILEKKGYNYEDI